MRYSPFLIAAIVLLQSQIIAGQYYDTGQDPSSLKWMQIKTDRFTVIYPEKYGSGGIAYASALDEAYSRIITLFPEKKFLKLPVIIHNFSTQSNGYVAWAPRRMELYPTPEQDGLPLDSKKQLSLHELTHVLQMESLNKGFSKIMTILLGEQFIGIVSSLLPMWYLEGDAVFAETILSGSGRGRSPSFQKQFKALIVESPKNFKYDKILNGSFKDYVPDYYQSGYQMVTWARLKYNRDIWNKVIQFTAEQPFTLNPVNISLNKYSGLKKKKLYNETFDTLKTIWSEEIAGSTVKYEAINPDKKGKHTNYYSPVFAGEDSIIAVKTSLSSIPSFVLINPSKKTEKNIHRPGYMYPLNISFAMSKVVWVENRSDERWENRDYSIIRMLDLKKNSISSLSHRSRYLASSISPDGKLISAVENTIDNHNNLIIIDSESGDILRSVPSPGDVYLQHPQWSAEGEKITVISLTEYGEGIISYSFPNNKWEVLIDPGKEDLQSSFLKNDSLYFISSYSGTDNIFVKTHEGVKQITRSMFGTLDINLKGDNIMFSDYTSDGNSICIIPAAKVFANKDNINESSYLINRFDSLNKRTEDKSDRIYTPEPYRKWQHLLRFHSWMPFYADLDKIQTDPSSIRPGFSLNTQNNLSTLISSIGYEYSEDKMHLFHSRITWKGLYPVIESRLDYGGNPVIMGNPPNAAPAIRFSNTISVPLRYSSGRFSQFLRPSVTSEYYNNIYQKESRVYDYGQTIFSGRLYFSNYSRSALRDIYPKWAQTFDINYVFAPFDIDIFGSTAFVKTAFFFPGLLSNNGIKIRLEKEKKDKTKSLSGNRVSFPRGYSNILSADLSLASIDYVFPVAYPDFNISSIIYLKRIRSGLFYDYGSGIGNYFFTRAASGALNYTYHDYQESFKSFGLEFLGDFHLLRIPFMISGGVQAAWKDLGKKPIVNLLFNIDLYGMTIGRGSKNYQSGD